MKKIGSYVIPIVVFIALCGAIIFFDHLLESYWPETDSVDEYDEWYNDGYNWGHEEGLSDGYIDGYNEAMSEAPVKFKDHLYYEIWDLECDISSECGIHPEEALVVLSDYLDGEPVSNAELNSAIDAISQYYYSVGELVTDIDEDWLD